MSERWKYQIRTGVFCCAFITIFGTLFEFRMKSFSDQLVSGDFYIRILGSLLFGVFIIGYFAWKRKVKNLEKS